MYHLLQTKRLLLACSVILFTLLSTFGCSATHQQTSGMILMPSPQPTQIYCIGRLQLTMPQNATVLFSGVYHSNKIERLDPISFNELEKQLTKQAKALDTIPMERKKSWDELDRSRGKNPDLEYGKTRLLALKTDPSQQQIVFGFHEDNFTKGITVELHKIINQQYYLFKRDQIGANKYPWARDQLLAASQHFIPITANTLPQQSGFCIEEGIFVDQKNPKADERTNIAITFPHYPGISMAISTDAIDEPSKEPSLAEREGFAMGILRSVMSDAKVISKGKQEVAGLPGYVIVLRTPDEEQRRLYHYDFTWEYEGTPNDVYRPYMDITLTIDPRKGNNFIQNEYQAKELWNTLLSGIKIRTAGSIVD